MQYIDTVKGNNGFFSSMPISCSSW